MKKTISHILTISLLLLMACGHFVPFIFSYMNCIFYGECSQYYYGGSVQSVQLAASDQNDGITLNGEWQNKNAEISYNLNFLNNGKLNITLYQNGKLERYDAGTYSINKNIVNIEMENGTISECKFSIKERILTLTKLETEQETIQTAE